MYIYIYIILLIIFIVIIEIINNFQLELFGNRSNESNESNGSNGSNESNKSNYIDNRNLINQTNELFYCNKIPINNEEKKIILFNSDVNFSPIEKFNILHNNNIIELNDYIGKIYFNIPEKFLDFIHIFFNIDSKEWLLANNKTIYEFKLKTHIKIIYLTIEIKEIEFFTNF